MNLSDCAEAKPLAAVPSCETQLQQALAVYHQVMIGDPQVTSIRNGDESVNYDTRSVGKLLDYIQALNMQCPCRNAMAVLGVPMNRGPSYLVYGSMSVPRRGCRGC